MGSFDLKFKILREVVMDLKSLVPFHFGDEKRSVKEMQRDMDRMFNEFSKGMMKWPPSWPRDIKHMLSPDVDVVETEKNIIFKAELPGLTADDINATISNNVLTIQGEKKVERKEEKENYHLIERSSGTFSRSFTLPFEAKPGDFNASFKDGVLTIEIPKPKKEKTGEHKIKIKKEG